MQNVPQHNMLFLLFFFQAEDGIRDWSVTGVQTCALPISSRRPHTTLVSDSSSDTASSQPSEEQTTGVHYVMNLGCRFRIGVRSCRSPYTLRHQSAHRFS